MLASGNTNTVYARWNHDSVGKPSVRLTVWMPDRHGSFTFSDAITDNDDANGDHWEEFFQDNCRSCYYYFNTRDFDPSDVGFDEEDQDGNKVVTVRIRSCCPCCRDGISYVEFPCAAGHDEPEPINSFASVDNDVPPMAYAIDLQPTTGERMWEGVWMQRINTVSRLATGEYPALNTYGDRSVCWGNDNTVPQSLPEIIDQVLDSPANEDLGTAADLERNRINVRNAICDEPLKGSFICSGYDAALLVHAAHQSSAYLLLRGSGLEAHNGVIAVGLNCHTLEQDGQTLQGYITTPGYGGLCWFLIHETSAAGTPVESRALLLGQIPNPHNACTSTEPSSSEPAALAVS